MDTTFVQLSFTQGKIPIPVYCDEYSLKYSAGKFGGEVESPVEKTTSIYSFWVPPIKSTTVVIYQLYCKETGKAVKSGSIILNPPKKP